MKYGKSSDTKWKNCHVTPGFKPGAVSWRTRVQAVLGLKPGGKRQFCRFQSDSLTSFTLKMSGMYLQYH